MGTPSFRRDFLQANGVRLHYLDWGGSGPVVLFLPGLGWSAYYYADFAGRFADKFRVVALTRRGHGDSGCPAGGYDAGTLGEDVRQFIDALGIDKVILVGHSLANVELGRLAFEYSSRVNGLVYLDAGYFGPMYKSVADSDPLKDIKPPEEDAFTIEQYVNQLKRARPDLEDIWCEPLQGDIPHLTKLTPEGKVVSRMPDEVAQVLTDTFFAYSPELAGTQLPVLGVYAIWDDYCRYIPHYLTPEQAALKADFNRRVEVPFQKDTVRAFRELVPQATIVEIPHGHHYCFIKHEALVYDVMMSFIAESV